MPDLVTTETTSHDPIHSQIPARRRSRPQHRPNELDPRLEQHRSELTGYCYRMLGSGFEAEDAVQEALVRAWRGLDRFEGRSALRSWLYSIATNVCYDMLKASQRRARPMDFGGPSTPEPASLGVPLAERTWVEPIPDSQVVPADADPAEQAVARESIRLAFVATLQHLPPRQRAVLILREVLRWKAEEVAELLDTTVASVNSALQRARAKLAESDVATASADPHDPEDEEQQKLLARYVDVFESYDIDSLVSLLHEDATLSMPPFKLWMRGPVDIAKWHLGPGIGCRGSRLLPTVASGLPAFGQYRPSATGKGHDPWALQVIEVSGDRIIGLNAFLDTAALFPLFGLPDHLDSIQIAPPSS